MELQTQTKTISGTADVRILRRTSRCLNPTSTGPSSTTPLLPPVVSPHLPPTCPSHPSCVAPRSRGNNAHVPESRFSVPQNFVLQQQHDTGAATTYTVKPPHVLPVGDAARIWALLVKAWTKTAHGWRPWALASAVCSGFLK